MLIFYDFVTLLFKVMEIALKKIKKNQNILILVILNLAEFYKSPSLKTKYFIRILKRLSLIIKTLQINFNQEKLIIKNSFIFIEFFDKKNF